MRRCHIQDPPGQFGQVGSIVICEDDVEGPPVEKGGGEDKAFLHRPLVAVGELNS